MANEKTSEETNVQPPQATDTPPTAGVDAQLMEDFVFGGIEADSGRLLEYERLRWHGVRHEYALDPLDPAPGEPVLLTVTAGPDAPVDHVCAYVTLDGSAPQGRRGEAHNGLALPFYKTETRWEPMVWSYVEVWQATLPAQPEGVFVRYDIEAWHSHTEESFWSREQNIDRTIDAITHYGFNVDTFAPPMWAREAVIYQIFVDRFRDHRRTDAEHDYLAIEPMRTFWGGTLRGILDSLDYIEALGITVIWLTPIFKTRSYHGYDITDYYEVDARFGTNDELRELVQAAHARGMRVILDLVVNHVSLDFPPFVAALADADAAEREWFRFSDAYTHGYRTFFEVASMPQLELDSPAARDYVVEVAAYWLREYDVDGYRLDYAAGPSHLFWSWFRRECRAVKPDCWVFGEVTRAGALLRAYTGRLDGCLDFGFARAVRRLCAPGSAASASIGEFAEWVRRTRIYFGDQFSLPSFLDNHDMNRFLWVARDDKQLLRLATGLLLGLGETPIIYYGTEVGLNQPRPKANRNEEARHPMWWSSARQDAALLHYFQQWIAARKQHPALMHGDMRTLHLNEAAGVWLVERRWQEDIVLLAFNAHAAAASIPLPDGTYVDLEGAQHHGMMQLAGHSAALLVA